MTCYQGLLYIDPRYTTTILIATQHDHPEEALMEAILSRDDLLTRTAWNIYSLFILSIVLAPRNSCFLSFPHQAIPILMKGIPDFPIKVATMLEATNIASFQFWIERAEIPQFASNSCRRPVQQYRQFFDLRIVRLCSLERNSTI